jgi:hypothetical protein
MRLALGSMGFWLEKSPTATSFYFIRIDWLTDFKYAAPFWVFRENKLTVTFPVSKQPDVSACLSETLQYCLSLPLLSRGIT